MSACSGNAAVNQQILSKLLITRAPIKDYITRVMACDKLHIILLYLTTWSYYSAPGRVISRVVHSTNWIHNSTALNRINSWVISLQFSDLMLSSGDPIYNKKAS